MRIINTAYLAAIKKLKNDYAELPLYKRFWFSLWSYSFSSALSNVDVEQPTNEQVEALMTASEQAWFFKSIFGLIDRFRAAVSGLSYEKTNDNEPFTELPNGLADLVLSLVPTDDLVDSGLKSPKGPFFWKELKVHKFLAHAVHGEYDKVKAMLQEDTTLPLTKGTVTDYSGRTFTSISGFEYALWALDKHMWALMLDCLPPNEEGIKIKQSLLEQYRKVKDKGVTYRFEENPPITEPHFDFQNTLIKELQIQVDSANAPNPDWNEVDKQWRGDVGGVQKLLPMHVVYEYCSDVPFDPKPTFTKQPRLKKQFYNWITNALENWFHRDSKLGINFGIVKAVGGVECAGPWGGAAADLAAITTLCEVRTNDFNDLKQQLESNLVDIPDVVSQMRS